VVWQNRGETEEMGFMFSKDSETTTVGGKKSRGDEAAKRREAEQLERSFGGCNL
jgi:hypothetical protein